MGPKCGIVGLPNVGKSTIFQAMTSASVEVANYPFCTINPNIGVVEVDDYRLAKLVEIFSPKSVVPAVVEFVDIAGLVKGASKGEGLGNQFLGHIRQVDAIIHLVRCFDDPNITHVSGKVDPITDIEIINMELAMADLEVISRKLASVSKLLKSNDKNVAKQVNTLMPVLENLKNALEKGEKLEVATEDLPLIKDLQLISLKKVLYVCNISEKDLGVDNDYVKKVRNLVGNDRVLAICGKIESEIAVLDSKEEKTQFLQGLGLQESGLHRLIRSGYDLLGLKTFFTAGEKEVRAWTFTDGMLAPQTAGIIHSDFERGFIKAEVYSFNDLMICKTESNVKSAGKIRIEGKDYPVQDGDVILFRFNV
jgi:GTP-binding protein YchF